MSADDTAPISFVVQSGTYEKVHYALVMAAGAAAMGTATTLFFTMGAAKTLLAGSDDRPGWHLLASEKAVVDAKGRDMEFASRNVATMAELLEACRELDVTFMVCEMGLVAEGIADRPLRDDLPIERTGVVALFGGAGKNGRIVFV